MACNSLMFHTYTSKKDGRKYRYYVCLNAHKRGYKNCPTRSVNAQEIENAVILSLIKITSDSGLRKEALNDVNKQIREEIEAHNKTTKTLIENARNLHDKIDNLKEALKNSIGNKRELEQQLKNLTAKYGDYDRLLTKARLKEMALGQKLITDRELEEALIVRLPIWDTLFPQEKHKVLKLILKEVEYGGEDGRAMYPSDGYLSFSRVVHGSLHKEKTQNADYFYRTKLSLIDYYKKKSPAS